ncbi:hypothetical protein KC332_g5664 [Hortaea werneckii]|nr:hypothetical protein KC358_g5505 [Hortaea werneckii]KAI6853217.1 hypothetical protein KC350_g156 [Hortaea werneckii]KAI6934324.1 hypothetical protein KC348_g6536 [Hortaea werneckii]KAI6945298.1 hypothetical protein KC341_g202 [Hortaea werneckii]KAI6973401.1 hypothetical protein KC321_g5696 [Hortaea werneckii]
MAAAITSSLAGAAQLSLLIHGLVNFCRPLCNIDGKLGLSNGQIAGIVVGCVVGGLLLIGIGLFCCCRSFFKKRKAKKHQAQLDEQSIMEKTKEPIHSEANPNYSGTGTQQGRPEQYLQRPHDNPPASEPQDHRQQVQQPMQQPTTP